jgi:hypothetical protein
MTYSYTLNENNELIIFENNQILATLSDVEPKQADNLFKEVVFELRSIEI